MNIGRVNRLIMSITTRWDSRVGWTELRFSGSMLFVTCI